MKLKNKYSKQNIHIAIKSLESGFPETIFREQTQPKTTYSKKVFLFLKSTFVSPKLAQTQVKIILNLTSKGILKKITRELFIFLIYVVVVTLLL
jgi:hypothetical protein